MSFKKSSLVSFLASSGESRRKPNQRGKSSYKLAENNGKEQYRESSRKQDDFTSSKQDSINTMRLYKGMESKDAEIQIYMIRPKGGFEEILLKQQFLELVKQSDKAIKRWYYEKGSAGELQSTIDSFIEEMKIFIAGKDLEDIERFREESWSEYIYSLKLSCTNKKDNYISIIKKLRSMHATRALEILFFSIDDLTKIIERVKEFENHKIRFKISKSCRDHRSFKKNSNMDNLHPKT
ncbi:hypothetical protein DMUE_1875 [Dictyocoela muelleri]|nr:hypothetical protein DMUE_1875 [Dictyocoela muelleri]